MLAVERKGSCPLEWGEGEHKLVGFSQRVKFQEAGVMCKGLGGSQVSARSQSTPLVISSTQVSPTSVSDLEALRESFVDIKKCNSNVFVPIRRQNGRCLVLTFCHCYCRSLTKVKFSTDQVRPAIG